MPITLSQARQNAINRRLNAVKRSAAPTQGAEIAQYGAQTQLPVQQENPQNNGGFWGGVGYTLGKAGTGALRGLEGIWDFVAGGIADLFGADEWAEEQLTTSPFDEWNEELDAWYNPSGVMEFVGDVAGGVGQMLPSIAVSAIPYVGPALSTGMFVTSAAGMGVSEAAKESGELGAKEWLYGAGSGAVEGAIEKLSGGIGGTKLGTVLGKQVAKSTGGKLAATFVGEGLEEVASDLIDPALRRVTGVDPDATVDVSQLPNTFLVGGTAGALLGGGSRLVNAKRAGGFNNLNAMEDANAIREARARGNTLQAEGRLTDSWADTLSKSEQEAAKRLSTRLQRMNADTRAQFIEQNNLGDMFDADGALVENTVTGPQEYNRDAVSYSARNLVGRTDANGNSVLKYAPTKNAVREDIAQAAKDIAKLSNGDSRYVVVDTLTVPESGQKANAFYDNETGIMYIANDADMGDTRSFVVSHEYVHSLEGSGQYSKYANEVLAEIAQSPEYRKKYNYDEYYARYKQAHPDVQEETLNYIVETEMVADFTAKEILTNESAIRRLANRDASLVRRIYEWVKEKIRRLTSGGGNRENVAYLRRAEKLLAKAMDEPGGGISISEMDEYVREENARRNEREADAEAEAAEAGEARRLADVRMSVQEVDGKPIVVIDTDQDIFDGAERSEYGKIVRDYMREHFRGQTINGIRFNSRSEKEYTMSGDSQGAYRQNDGRYETKMRAGTELANLIQRGTFIGHEDAKHPHTYNAGGYNRYSVEFILDDVPFSGEMLVALNGEYGAFYDIVKIKRNGSTIRDVPKSVERVSMEESSSTNSIRDNAAKVNTSGQNFSGRYSVSAERPARDENYVNNRLKSYTYSDVDKIVENLTINKYGDDVVLRHKGNIGRQIYSMLNEASLRNRRAEAEKIARRIVYQELAAQTLLNAEEIENARRNGIEISETWIDKKLSSQLSSSENEAFVRELRDELLNAFETTGKLNDAGKMYLRYKDMSDRLRTVIAKEEVLKTARKLKKKNYPLAFDGFDSVKKALSKIEYRSDINKSSTRDIVSAFSQFYTAQNEALDGYYSNEVREAIDNFLNYNGTGDLDLYELEQLNTVLQAADHLLRTYDKAFLNDRTISVTKTANEEIATVKENAPVYRYTPLGRKGVLGQALRSIVDMRTLMRWIDGGKSGVMSELFEQLAHGSTVQTVTVMDLNKDFEKFIKSHKKFYKELDKNLTFKYNGTDAEITRAEAISLYLTALQEDGLYHLAFGGFAVNDGRDTVRRYYGKKPFYGQQEDVDAYEREVLREIKADMNALYEQFNEAEKEYIGMARDLFNNKAKKIKQDVDMKRMGITNARVDNYFPMRVYERGAGAQKPAQGFIQELNLIANQSIHKDRVKGSKQTLLITPVNTVIMNHIRQIAMYNAYAIPLDTFRRVLNKNVSVRADGKTDTAHAVTLKTTIQEDAWADFAKFIEKFEMDVQGAQVRTDTFDRIFRWMRSNYAKFQLGLNIKTMASQLTSLPMVGGRVGWGNLLKGAFAKPNISEMFEYSEWARARAYEGAAYKSQALVDNLDTIGQLAMKPIGWVDMFTMNRIYNAAKYYIASRDGVSLNSVECKTKAAEMLEELGRQTQNNSEVAERSAVMRSGNEIMKSVVMFSSDAMKQFSTLVQAFDKISFIKQKLKRGIGNAEALQKELSAARREARQALASVASSMTFYVLMGMLINYGLFAKEPEDDETMVTIFLKNLGGSVTGMIPIVRELYSFFVEGYELDNFAYDTFNGLTSAVKNMFDLFARAGSGERVTNQEWMLAMRKFIYAAGQVTGLPTRNIYNQMYGLIKRFSPSAAYEINSMFYGASTGDLTKAIEKGDVSLATTVTQELLAGKGIDASESVAEEFARLYAEGYSLPRGIPESVTVDDEEVVLNARQAGIVLDKYAEASVQAEGLINSQEFAALDDNGKADALRLLFNYYYYAGVNEATGAYADNRTLLLGEAIDISKVAAAYGQLSELKADTNRTGNAIAGTKKAKIQRVVNGLRLTAAQKYILMGFLGYKNANGENTVKSYIRSLGLSEEGQLALLEMCGYDASSK